MCLVCVLRRGLMSRIKGRVGCCCKERKTRWWRTTKENLNPNNFHEEQLLMYNKSKSLNLIFHFRNWMWLLIVNVYLTHSNSIRSLTISYIFFCLVHMRTAWFINHLEVVIIQPLVRFIVVVLGFMRLMPRNALLWTLSLSGRFTAMDVMVVVLGYAQIEPQCLLRGVQTHNRLASASLRSLC